MFIHSWQEVYALMFSSWSSSKNPEKKWKSCTFPTFCIVTIGLFSVIEYFEMNALFNCLLKAL